MGIQVVIKRLSYITKKRKKDNQVYASDYLTIEASEDIKVFSDESLNQLYKAIKLLSETDRAVILLYLEENPYKEIAEIIGTNVSNISTRVNRIKKRLKTILDEKIN